MTSPEPPADEALLQQLSYIIPVRTRDASRQRNLIAVIRWLAAHLPGVQIVIVEQDEVARARVRDAAPGHLDAGRLEHLLVSDGGDFDKGWVLNCGARRSKRPLVAFGDADVAVAPSQLMAALRLLRTFDAVKPYHRAEVIDLDERETAYFAKTSQVGGLTGVNRRGMTNFAGGLFVMRRDAFLEIGGFPEGFCGWGGEDDAMGILIERLTRHAELPGPCIHLAHPPEEAKANDPRYVRNVERLIQVARASTSDLRAWSIKRRITMGDARRPSQERWHPIVEHST